MGHNDRHAQSLGPISGKQSSGHRNAATPVQSAEDVSKHTTMGVKLNTLNQAPSVHYMKSALKPSGSSIPFSNGLPPQAPRTVPWAHRQDEVTTRLPSPGLAIPESESAKADSGPLDVDDMEVAPPSPPVMNTERGQRVMEHQSRVDTVGQTKQETAMQAKQSPCLSIPPPPEPLVSVGKINGKDSTVSGIPLRQSTPRTMQPSPSSSRVSTSTVLAAPVTVAAPNVTNTNSSSEAADHLLIFLKEVKKLKWADITKEFTKDIPGRTYTQLQSRYSVTINRRDRAQDPPTLILPPRFASEATIDWGTIHAETPGPRPRSQVAGLASSGGPKPSRQQHTVQKIRDYDDSSGTDSAPQRQRSRRVAPVNYKLLGMRFAEGGMEEGDEESFIQGSAVQITALARSESPMDRTLVKSDASAATHAKSKLMEMKHDSIDAQLGLATQRSSRHIRQETLPYLSSSQRRIMREEPEAWVWDQRSIQDWQGVAVHVDLSPEELQTVERVVANTARPASQIRHSTYRRYLRASLKRFTEPRLRQLAYELCRHLRSRDVQSMRCFLDDAVAGKISDVPQVHRLATSRPSPRPRLSSISKSSLSTVVRQRELGNQSTRGWRAAATPLSYQTKNKLIDTLGPKSTWTGASSDIHTVAWSPDGQYFAAGAVAVTDTDSMQYNRPNNLLYCDTINNNIHNLGEHCIDRPRTVAGANSTHAMYVSQDPKLYTTVSSVAFSPSGNLMYSAGYDNSVCIWDITANSEQPQMARKLQHKEPVDILAVNQHFNGTIATASKRTTGKAIKLVYFEEDMVMDDEFWDEGKAVMNFASAKAVSRPDLKMTATALQFSPDGSLLLAGFGANNREDTSLDTTGDICLWDINTETAIQVHGSSRNVFDVTFNPASRTRGLFAVGCVASGNVNRGTRSVVRFYNPKTSKDYTTLKFTSPMELECRAYDMNDIVWW